jgi:hypothetical protein
MNMCGHSCEGKVYRTMSRRDWIKAAKKLKIYRGGAEKEKRAHRGFI